MREYQIMQKVRHHIMARNLKLFYNIMAYHLGKNRQVPVDLVTFTEEIFHGKFTFLCSVMGDQSVASIL